MDYDFRNKAGPEYDTHSPVYNRPNTSSSSSGHPMYGHPSLYPKIGQHGSSGNPPVGRTSNYPQTSPPSSSPGLGIRVAIKQDYRITPPPHLSPHVGDIPRSTFSFDFEFERKILAEVEKENQNWSKFGLPYRTAESTPSLGPATDPVVSKHLASGLSREAVSLAVAKYGDHPTKVKEFVKGYNLLREMGFSSTHVAEALVMYDNDTDEALAHFLNSSS